MIDHTADWAGIRTWRARVPGVSPDITLPMIAVCTVPKAELSNVIHDVDVADAHTSWFWASTRDEFRTAHRMARMVARGLRFAPSARSATGSLETGGVYAGLLSAHHVAPEVA